MKRALGVQSISTGVFTPADRLHTAAEFKHVLGRGRRVVKREVVVVVAPTVARLDGDARRLGITVSRRVGGAVVRNRLKRWVREWFRVARQSLVAGSDVLVIVRRPAVSLSVQAFRTVLDRSLAEVAR